MNFPGISPFPCLSHRSRVLVSICLLLSAFAALLPGCGSDRPASEPSVSDPNSSPTRLLGVILPTVTREQAIFVAEAAFAENSSTTTAVDNPHNTVARLMTIDELREAESLPIYPAYRNKLVWVVQIEGESRPAKGSESNDTEPLIYRFNAAVVDATDGQMLIRLQSEFEPFILPLEFLPEELVNVESAEHSASRSALAISREEAIQFVVDEYGNRRQNLDAIETVLVRYSNPSGGEDVTFGPRPTPTRALAVQPTPTATSSVDPPIQPTATSAPRLTPTPVVDRLSWLVIIPGELSFSGCFISGPTNSTHSTCWMSVHYFVVDAETGALMGGGGGTGSGQLGPRMTNEESLAFQHYAWSEGWWSLWHSLRQYNGERVPPGLAAELDRPNAPTPTQRPATPTPDPALPPTPTPTPPPTATPT